MYFSLSDMILVRLLVASLLLVYSNQSSQPARSRRAILKLISYHQMSNLITAAQGCCDAPVLIPNYARSCGPTSRKVAYTTGLRLRPSGLFVALRTLLSSGLITARARADEVVLNLCYADCAYQGLGLAEPPNWTDSAPVNFEKMYELLIEVAAAYPAWSDVIANATEHCNATAFEGPKAVLVPNGKVCSTYPLRFSVCMRRYVLTQCLADNTTQSKECETSLDALRSVADGFSLRPVLRSTPYKLS